MGKSLRMVSFSILVASILIIPKKVSPMPHFTKTLSSSMEVFSSLGLCLMVLALKVPEWVLIYLNEFIDTQHDAVEELFALADGQLILIDFRFAVALLDLHLAAAAHMVLQHAVLLLDLGVVLLLLLLLAVRVGSNVDVLRQVVLVLLLRVLVPLVDF